VAAPAPKTNQKWLERTREGGSRVCDTFIIALYLRMLLLVALFVGILESLLVGPFLLAEVRLPTLEGIITLSVIT
jgi:hypothetical protein